jgi:tetratricopeptide (TPR) repeat protein
MKATFSSEHGYVFYQFLWVVGGGNRKILSDCPRNERAKYGTLGALSYVLSALIGWIAYVWLGSALPKQASQFIQILTGIGSFYIAAGILAAANRIFGMPQLGRGRYWIGFFVSLPLIGTVTYMISNLYLMRTPTQAYAYAGFIIWAILLVVGLRISWRSPVYDALLLHAREGKYKNREESPPQSVSGSFSQTLMSDERKKLESLEQQFLAIRTVEPQNLDVAFRLIDIRKQLGKYEEAVEIIDELINKDPTNIELIQEKAGLYGKMGDDRRYRKTLEQADSLLAEDAFKQNLGKHITLLSMEVKDLDFFADFVWEFRPGVNVLLGRNGYGKSHLLRALASLIQNDEEIVKKFFINSGSRAKMRLDIDREGIRASTSRTPMMFDESFGKVPLLAIPDMRYINKSSDNIGLTKDEMTDLQNQSAWHFMREAPYEGVIIKFLYGLCLDYLDHKSLDLPIFRLVTQTVGKLTGNKFEFAEILRRDNAQFEILVLTEGNDKRPLPIQKASQGTLSVVSMFGIIYQYLKAIHEDIAEDSITSQRGIVMIDEIDAHLHPSWQQMILQLLRDTYPNVQFIVTAHSPLVVAGCKAREVAVLSKSETGFRVEVLPDHFIGATSGDLYQRVFEIEDTDKTYQRLNASYSTRPNMEKEIADLEKQSKRSAQQENRLAQLKDQLHYLQQFVEVKAERDKAKKLESEYQRLEMEFRQLRGENNRLTKQLQDAEKLSTAPDTASLVKLLEELRLPNDAQRALLEAAAKERVERGNVAESALILEALTRLDPKNLEYLKQLASRYLALESFQKAGQIVATALRIAPDDGDLQTMSQRLVNIDRA